MSQEMILMLAAAAAVGWLLRHYGYGAHLFGGTAKASPFPATVPAAPAAQSATANQIKAEAEAAIQAAVSSAVTDALGNLKTQLGVKEAK